MPPTSALHAPWPPISGARRRAVADSSTRRGGRGRGVSPADPYLLRVVEAGDLDLVAGQETSHTNATQRGLRGEPLCPSRRVIDDQGKNGASIEPMRVFAFDMVATGGRGCAQILHRRGGDEGDLHDWTPPSLHRGSPARVRTAPRRLQQGPVGPGPRR